jgi:hypothetical protein
MTGLIAIKKEKKAKKPFSLDKYKTYDTSDGFGSPEDWIKCFETRMNFKVLTVKEEEDNRSVVDCMYDCKTGKELQKIYHTLMLKWHPDRAGDTPENKTIAQLINDTYFKLKVKFK